jgi:hypothetical protein
MDLPVTIYRIRVYTRKSMKNLILFALFSSCPALFAQVSIAYLMEVKPEFETKYQTRRDMNGVRINMPFADDSVLNPGVVHRLMGQSILRVDLVYTDYRELRTFDQPELNQSRLQKLFTLLPEAFQNTGIDWHFIAQTGCNNPGTCKDFQHGFVIYYQTPAGAASYRTAEIKHFDSMFKKEKVIASISKYRKRRMVMYEPILKWKRVRGILYKHPGIWGRKEVVICDSVLRKRPKIVYKEVLKMRSLDSGTAAYYAMQNYRPDSTVHKVLERNKDWNHFGIAVDVTGSMSPYTTQVMQWVALETHIQSVNGFAFFNDGDSKPDGLKIAGNTGGIYTTKSNEYTEVVNRAKFAMRKGFGGDSPENDVEAIIQLIKENPALKEIVLIADNYANMRDIKLANKIHIPVRIILCGAGYGVNAQYLKLARITGGSVHTMEEDLTHLADLAEGETFHFSGQKFKLIKGEFILSH